jgi:hypothetical protein
LLAKSFGKLMRMVKVICAGGIDVMQRRKSPIIKPAPKENRREQFRNNERLGSR